MKSNPDIVAFNCVKDLIENFSKVTSIKNNYPKSYQEIVNKLECYGLTFDSDIKKVTENTKSKKHKYGDIEEPTAEELAAIERELNPDELLHEDLFSGFSSEYDIDDRWLDFSRTEGGYKRKQKNVDKSNQNLNKDNINNISLDELAHILHPNRICGVKSKLDVREIKLLHVSKSLHLFEDVDIVAALFYTVARIVVE